MKKKFLLVLTSAIVLSGCNLNLADLLDKFKNPGENTTNQTQDDDHESDQEQHHEGEHQEEGHHEEEHQEEHHDDDNEDQEEEHHDDDNDDQEEEHGDYQYSLNDYTNFAWHNGHEPEYAGNWEYHIKDTINPGGALWENPNESVDYSGVVFKDRNSYIISPTFKSWKKVEVRLSLWFSSNQKEATKDAPQMYIEEYSSTNQLLGKDEINIARSDVPSNNTPYISKHYLKNSSMSYFILRHNNYVYNGNNASYYLVLTEATLKGWDYD